MVLGGSRWGLGGSRWVGWGYEVENKKVVWWGRFNLADIINKLNR
mgnify:CR=1 FL=1